MARKIVFKRNTFSYLDPSDLKLKCLELTLKEVECLILEIKHDLEIKFKKWEKENKNLKKSNKELYLHQEDNYLEIKMYEIPEIEKNLLNGIAVTLHTIFENCVNLSVREMSKREPSIDYREKCNYKMKDFKNFLNKVNHPNRNEFKEDLLSRLEIYKEIRHCVAHREGDLLPEGTKKTVDIRPFILENQELFNRRSPFFWNISVKGDYIRFVMEDLKVFFRLLLYTKNGNVIFY